MSDQVLCALIGMVGSIGAAWVGARWGRNGLSKKGQEVGQDSSIIKRMGHFMKKKIFIFFLAPLVGLGSGWVVGNVVAQNAIAIKAPFNVSNYFAPSGWMGDGEEKRKEGEELVQLNDQWKENFHSPPTCIKISYFPGNVEWAGVYWQYPDKNWGDKQGRKITGGKRITFWARGDKGGELVQFKAGGIFVEEKKYHDSFEVSIEAIRLTKEWHFYQIPLSEADLSSVIGAFAWTANIKGNPEGLTFYLDDIRYEKE